ncbi:hypothetical protein PMAYCL1PPCAC_20841, partial [Pristionchus mayeri]
NFSTLPMEVANPLTHMMITANGGPRTQAEQEWLETMKNYLLVQNPYEDLLYIQDVEGVYRDDKVRLK